MGSAELLADEPLVCDRVDLRPRSTPSRNGNLVWLGGAGSARLRRAGNPCLAPPRDFLGAPDSHSRGDDPDVGHLPEWAPCGTRGGPGLHRTRRCASESPLLPPHGCVLRARPTRVNESVCPLAVGRLTELQSPIQQSTQDTSWVFPFCLRGIAMKMLLPLVMALGMVSLATAEDKKDPTAGKWVVESVTKDGKSVDALKGAVRVNEGGKYTLTPAADSKYPASAGTYTLDLTKSPVTFDAVVKGGSYDGKTLLGILKVDGETLTLAFSEPGKERPTKFESAAGSGVVVAVYKKAK
ncbi:MAG: hypothetical protein C0467_19155 [Planctomycetaceae bacterium]|nr:hypothetical protein [Planctomycetaceae bacterium]